MLPKELEQQLVDMINEQLKTDFIMLFGSYAKGCAREESDIDLAYFSDQQLSSYERFVLAGDLAALAGREIDLVDLKKPIQFSQCKYLKTENRFI